MFGVEEHASYIFFRVLLSLSPFPLPAIDLTSLHIPISEYDHCMFSDEAIDKFIAIYEKKYEEPISRADAIAMATQLVDLYKVLRQLIPPEKLKEFLDEEG